MPIVCGTLTSKLVGQEMPYQAILPNGYSDTSGKYPVLYLLHGLLGSFENWTELTRVAQLVDGRNMIVITPEARDGWYVDSSTTSDSHFESYVIDELMPVIENQFRIDSRPEMTAIAGNSMGGYGAIKFGLKYPGRFAFAASFSGAFEAPHLTDESPGPFWDEFKPSIVAAFGPENSSVRRDEDLFGLIDKLSEPVIDKLPGIYMDCGADDHFIEVNRRLSEAMRKKGIRHEFHKFTGGHDWEYWDGRVAHLIETLGRLPGWQQRS